jgi:RNA polymerase sigma-70 factor (ECF subfamily)
MTATAERSAHAEAPAEDARLFASFLAGDDTAAIRIFKKYNRRLFIYCAKMIGSSEQAEDLTQEIWERVIRLRSDPPTVLNPTGFLLRAARNACINHLRSRRHLLPLGDLDEAAHPSYMPGEKENEMEERVVRGLDKLSLKYREVLVLNVYCGYRFDEIAGMLGKSSEAIWARASRARAQLRTIVADSLARESRPSADNPNDGGRR